MGLILNKAIAKLFIDVSFNGTDTSKNIDVSGQVKDARKSLVQLVDSDYERIYCVIKATSATNVQITTGVPLSSGTYRLILN